MSITDNARDELLLIEAVLKGYSASMARADALRAVEKLRAALTTPVGGEPVAHFINAHEGLLRPPLWTEVKPGTHADFTPFELHASPTNSGASSQLQGADDRLSLAIDWINRSPHGDNCYVSDHYEGDPGNRCNCGKEAILAYLESEEIASKPMCRDCADFGPICPNSGKPCTPPQAPSQPEAQTRAWLEAAAEIGRRTP